MDEANGEQEENEDSDAESTAGNVGFDDGEHEDDSVAAKSGSEAARARGDF